MVFANKITCPILPPTVRADRPHAVTCVEVAQARAARAGTPYALSQLERADRPGDTPTGNQHLDDTGYESLGGPRLRRHVQFAGKHLEL
jgi:hypothetical protein